MTSTTKRSEGKTVYVMSLVDDKGITVFHSHSMKRKKYSIKYTKEVFTQ